MKSAQLEISYSVYQNSDELSESDKNLLLRAREVTKLAYAPYSKFNVAAVALLANGQIVQGTNQENASTPAGLCAERVLLSTTSMLYPNIKINAMAISYDNLQGKSIAPATPCGICRQTLQEYEDRLHQPIRLILGGLEGQIFVFEKAGLLLPFAFTGTAMKKN